MGSWKKLNINVDNTAFLHLKTKDPIFMFADAPRLLKLIRNWLIDTGIIMADGSIVTKRPIEELLKISEVSSCYQLTKNHLDCINTQHQNVFLAAQLMSHSIGTALKHYLPGTDTNMAMNTSDFILLINKWFDVMNSSNGCAAILTKRPYMAYTWKNKKNITKRYFKYF